MRDLKLAPSQLFVGNAWQAAQSGRRFSTLDPCTEEVLAEVPDGDAADVDLAVRSARAAMDGGPWSRLSATERGRLLWKLGDLVAGSALESLAAIESADAGKPIGETRAIEMPLIAEIFQYYAGWATKLAGETLPGRGSTWIYTLREPVGVCGLIVPWNFPLLLASWKLAPALACGNACVLKPAEETPLSALKLAELVLEAGFPPGAVNVVTGDHKAGAALVKHPQVNKIAFTGSVETGKQVMREAAATLKRVSLELGGKSPNVIFADADLEAAVRGAVSGVFYNKGEVCSAGSRLLVEESIRPQLVEKLAQRAEKMAAAQGDVFDPKTRLGPQISAAQRDRILSYVERGKADGARLVAGGGTTAGPGGKGFFVQPTIFDAVQSGMTIAREEIFGPVAAVIPFRSAEEAARIANDTSYGLAAGVWTRDAKKAHQFARSVKAGTVWVNCYNLFDPSAPFGGFKDSGFGRELGSTALQHYTEVKSVFYDLG